MNKSNFQSIPPHYQTYISWVDNLPIKTALDKQFYGLQNLNLEVLEALGNQTYASGKWTVKEVLQHIIDWERIFCYRALVYARLDSNFPVSHDENLMAANSHANQRTIKQLIEELLIVRSSTISLFNSFTEKDLGQKANHSTNGISVSMIGYIIIGHQIHHLKIIEERYLPLLGKEKIKLLKGVKC